VWDVFSNKEAVDFVKKILSDKTRSLRSCDEIARALLGKALHRQDCNDNLSLVIVRFKPEESELISPTPQSPTTENVTIQYPSSDLAPPIRSIAVCPPSPVKSRSTTTSVPLMLQTKQSPSVPTLKNSQLLSIASPERLQSLEDNPFETIKSNESFSLSSRLSPSINVIPPGTTPINTKRLAYTYHPTTSESGSELSDPFSPSSFYSSPSSPSSSSTTENETT